ncbi:MAG: prephenate dehydrogenase [Candidatus Omnitrophota bacterium]
MKKYKKIAIIGIGLIGGSIGKAVLEKGLADEVVGICRRESSLDRAVKAGVFSAGYVNDYEKALKDAEIIFIATPVNTMKETFKKLAEVVKNKNVIVTDAGSTKKEIVDYAEAFKENFSFIGGHPLAGSEKSGVEYADGALFEGSFCILTKGNETNEEALKQVKKLWHAMGAKVRVESAEQHDKILAFTSHLPHVVAYALAGIQDKDTVSGMLSSGFKDTTRIASSDGTLWAEIFMSNKDNLLTAIRTFKAFLSELEEDIREGKKDLLKEKLEKCKKVRDEIVQRS